MVRMIRRDGGDAWVHESRVEEYQAAGWRLPPPPAPAKKCAHSGHQSKTHAKEVTRYA